MHRRGVLFRERGRSLADPGLVCASRCVEPSGLPGEPQPVGVVTGGEVPHTYTAPVVDRFPMSQAADVLEQLSAGTLRSRAVLENVMALR